jgi:hypothetical protein
MAEEKLINIIKHQNNYRVKSGSYKDMRFAALDSDY